MRYPVKYLSSQKQVRTGLCTGTKGSHALNLTAMDPFQYHIFWSDHRITEWFGLEGLYRNLVPTHLPWAGTPPPRSDVTAGAPIWDKKQVLSLIFIFDRLDSPSFHRRLGVFLQGVLWFKHRAWSLMKRLLSDILWPRLCRRQDSMLIMAWPQLAFTIWGAVKQSLKEPEVLNIPKV